MTAFKLALRTLFRTPFVTTVAIVSLSLGIGANAAIFSLFDQLLLANLPVHEPHRLVNLSAPGPKPGSTSCNQAGNCDSVFSYPMFRDLEKAQTVFTGIAAHRVFGVNLAARNQTTNGDGLLVSGSYFPVLGVHPTLGRLLGPQDDGTIGDPHVAVVSYAFWENRFARDPGVLNETLIVNGQALTIVGVGPREFRGTTLGARPAVFVPITLSGLLRPGFVTPASNGFDNRRAYSLYLFARLKPGVSIEQARAGMAAPYRAIINDVEAPLQKGMSDQTMARFKTKLIVVERGGHGQSNVSGIARGPMTLLLGVTTLVLVIACANIANLLLARSAARAGEMAIRLSIGASRWQLVRQLLGESCLLALLGGAAGILVARWTLYLIASILPAQAADTVSMTLDQNLLLFAVAITMATGVSFGLFPALHSTRPDLVSALKGQAGQPAGARSAARFRTSLATGQIALSMALLVAAGLFTKSLFNVSRVSLGVNADNVIMFRVSPELNGYKAERSRQLFEQLEKDLAALPGVTGVTTSVVELLGGSDWSRSVSVEGFQAGPDTDTGAFYNEIGPDYFKTLGVPLIAGREFTRADALGTAKVAIVNEKFASKFNIARDPVAKHIAEGGGSRPLDIEIVGVVRDSKYSDVKREAPPLFFRPYRQDERLGGLTFYLRTGSDPQALLATIPKVVSRLDPNLPVVDLRTLVEQVRQNVFLDRFISVLSAAFAALATLLAAIGLYGVLAYTVAQRTREIGLRMALGAAPARVQSMVLRQVGTMTALGGAIGLTAAIWLGRLAQSLLFEMNGSDLAVLTSSAVALTLVALAAGIIPARRASNIDPMKALRYE
jgi:putative ABC transport system permease protein